MRTVPLSTTIGAVLTAATGFGYQALAGAVPDADAVRAMHTFLNRPAGSHAYVAARRLEAAGSGQRGWLHAQTSFTPATGLHYQVTAEGGSGYIRSRVLRSLLEAERQLIAGGGSDGAALSRANYRFTPEALATDGLACVALEPLRKERSLIVGRMFLSPPDGQLVRLEGRLAKNPSFWVTRVDVVRSYQRLNGVDMPVSLQSTAQLRFLGRSTLRMTYHYSDVDYQAVRDESIAENDRTSRR